MKYVLSGTLFSIIGPLLFIYFSKFLPRVVVISLIEPTGYFLKFLIYKFWVFRKEKIILFSYLIHVTPLYFISLTIAKTTKFIDQTEYVAIIILIVNGISGYLWGKFVYSTDIKIKKNL